MAANTIDIFSYNILEDGTTTVAANTSNPASRLFDWTSSFAWIKTASGDITINIDQGASNIQDVDTLWVANHNFNGLDLVWEYSTDDIAYTDAVVWTQGDTNNIVKTISATQTKRYWQLTISGATNPQAGEVLMSDAKSFKVLLTPSATHIPESNISWTQSIGGQAFGVKLATQKKNYSYDLRLTDSDITNMNTVITNTNDFLEPTLIKDKDGVYVLTRFVAPPGYTSVDINVTDVDIRMVEVA